MRFGGTGSLNSSVLEVDDVFQVQVAGRLALLVDQHIAGEPVLRDRALDIGGGRGLGEAHEVGMPTAMSATFFALNSKPR